MGSVRKVLACSLGGCLAGAFLFSYAAIAVPISGQGTWETTLLPRDLTGDGVADAYYDTVLDLTWIADAKLSARNLFGLPAGTDLGVHPQDIAGTSPSEVGSDGSMNWPGALFWIDAMNKANYLGYDDWRLSTRRLVFTGSLTAPTYIYELQHLYYQTLGNRPVEGFTGALFCDDTLAIDFNPSCWNTGPFQNMEPFLLYWTDVEGGTTLPESAFATYVNMYSGIRGDEVKVSRYFGGFNPPMVAWAVRNGDVAVSVVPVPETVWLLGSGLVSLAVARRRRSGISTRHNQS